MYIQWDLDLINNVPRDLNQGFVISAFVTFKGLALYREKQLSECARKMANNYPK